MEPAAATRASSRYGARHLVPRLLAPLAAVVVAAIGLRVPGDWSAADAVAFVLAIAWALAGIAVPVAARTPRPHTLGQMTLGLLAALGALVAATALTAARIAGQDGTADQHQTARAVATLAAPLVIAVSFHFLLALPDGRLVQPGRRILAVLGYVSAVGTGAGLAVAHQPFRCHGGRVRLAARAAVRPAGRPDALRPYGRARPGADAVAGHRPARRGRGGAAQRGTPSPDRLARPGRRGGGRRRRGRPAGPGPGRMAGRWRRSAAGSWCTP